MKKALKRAASLVMTTVLLAVALLPLGCSRRAKDEEQIKETVQDFFETFAEGDSDGVENLVEEGFEFFADMKLVTIFTAPNYMGEFDNNGGILEVGEDLLCKFHVLRPNFERSGKRRRITQLVN